ncbi:MAG: DUF512 domain-containing protein [Anaerosomatales bacterium]|nr:DUF512 domain-containing protein [Anaerosomatales bacterium]
MEPGTPAARAGLAAGLTVVRANGRSLRDVIDWRWESDGTSVDLEISDSEGTHDVRLERNAGEAWGFTFAGVLFDGVRTCRNSCTFCFMSQLPRGLRRALYVRDDDYRLSFLQGNFVTLTNLTPADVDRIVEQHLSPLYVSLHAVTPEVRATLVCAREDRAPDVIDELLSEGIELHVQIVLVPGVNDGDELETSLRWLAARDGVRSVGIVPLGFTRHQQRFTTSYGAVSAARAVLDQLEPWQAAFRRRDRISWVHAADEFYLNAGRPVPPSGSYDGFPQYENGIGLLRDFEDELVGELRDRASAPAAGPVNDIRTTVVTGTLFAPALRTLLHAQGLDRRVDVLAVDNHFFGGNVSVSGLLTGEDVVNALATHEGSARFIMPRIIFNDDGLTLDDVSEAGIRASCSAPVDFVHPSARALLSAIL